MEKRLYAQPMAKMLSLNVNNSVCEEIVVSSMESIGPGEPKVNASGVIFED